MESGSRAYAYKDVPTLSKRTSHVAGFQTLLEGDIGLYGGGNYTAARKAGLNKTMQTEKDESKFRLICRLL